MSFLQRRLNEQAKKEAEDRAAQDAAAGGTAPVQRNEHRHQERRAHRGGREDDLDPCSAQTKPELEIFVAVLREARGEQPDVVIGSGGDVAGLYGTLPGGGRMVLTGTGHLPLGHARRLEASADRPKNGD